MADAYWGPAWPGGTGAAHLRPSAWGMHVRRDMELVREIMLAIEAKEDLAPRRIMLADRDPAAVAAHLELLYRSGLVRGIMHESLNGAGDGSW